MKELENLAEDVQRQVENSGGAVQGGEESMGVEPNPLLNSDENMEAVEDLTQDWTNLTHAFMEADVKEEAKKAFGFAAVPFYVVVNKDGRILGAGDPKKIDYEELLNAPAPEIAEIAEKVMPAPEEETKNVFTLDEDF